MAPTTGFWYSVAINSGLALLLLSLFCILRNKLPVVFEPRMDRKKIRYARPPPPCPHGLFSWIWHTIKISDDQVYRTAGLDAVMYIKFFALCTRLFFWSMIPAIAILLPIYYTDHNPIGIDTVFVSNRTIEEVVYPDAFAKISMGNLRNGSGRLYVSVIALWIFTLFAMYVATGMWQQYMFYRHQYLISRHLQGKSLSMLVTGIPQQCRTDDMLSHYFQSLYPDAFVSAYVARHTRHLRSLISDRKSAINRCEHAWHYYEKHGKRPMKALGWFGRNKVDEIEYWSNRIHDLNKQIRESQQHQWLHPSGYGYKAGFVTVNSSFILSALCYAEQTTVPFEYHCRPAPDPDDVYYKNLNIGQYEKMIRWIIVQIAVAMLVIWWMIPASIASSFGNLKQLAEKVPWLSFVADISPELTSLIQGLLPPIILALFLLLLPVILLLLCKVQGIEARTWQQTDLIKKMYVFMVFNYFLGVALSSAVFDQIAPILREPLQIPDLLGQSLPGVSTLFSTYILFKALSGFPVQALELDCLLWVLLYRPFVHTERDREWMERPSGINYGNAYPRHLLIVIIGCVYVVMAPIITVFATIYFGLGYLICKYQALYMLVPERESGGTHWEIVFGRLIASLIVAQLTMIGLFGIKQTPVAAALCIPLPVITYMFYWWQLRAYRNKCETLTLREAVAVDHQRKILLENNMITTINADGYRQRGVAPEVHENEPLIPIQPEDGHETNETHQTNQTHEMMKTHDNTQTQTDETIQSTHETENDKSVENEQTQKQQHDPTNTSSPLIHPVRIQSEQIEKKKKEKEEEKKTEERKQQIARDPNTVPDAVGIALGYGAAPQDVHRSTSPVHQSPTSNIEIPVNHRLKYQYRGYDIYTQRELLVKDADIPTSSKMSNIQDDSFDGDINTAGHGLDGTRTNHVIAYDDNEHLMHREYHRIPITVPIVDVMAKQVREHTLAIEERNKKMNLQREDHEIHHHYSLHHTPTSTSRRTPVQHDDDEKTNFHAGATTSSQPTTPRDGHVPQSAIFLHRDVIESPQ